MAESVCHLCGQKTPLGWDYGEGRVCPECEDENQQLAIVDRHHDWLLSVIGDRRAARRLMSHG